jgi:hypothetical protein
MGAYYSIESMLAIGVISTQWRSLDVGVNLVCAETTSPPDPSQYWEFVPDPAGSGYFFIKNKANGFVIDIEGESTATGALLVVNQQNETGTDSQLWQFFLDPSGSGYWMIMNKLTANVIDIQGDSPDDGVVLDSFPHTFPASRNELWSVIDGSFPGVVVAVPSPAAAAGLTGNSNYIFNQQCNPFVNPSPTDNVCLTVTIVVTQDIICKSVVSNGSTGGFSFQLNCYSPKGRKCAYQQYVIGLRGNNLMYNVEGFPVNSNQSLLNVGIDNIASLPSSMIPAGYQLTITLLSDSISGNVLQANFNVLDNEKNVVANIEQPVITVSGATEDDWAPIIAFELDFVGPENSESVYLSQGAGIITYWVPYRMTASSVRPDCAETGAITAEKANSVYASLPANRNNIFKQRFGVQLS